MISNEKVVYLKVIDTFKFYNFDIKFIFIQFDMIWKGYELFCVAHIFRGKSHCQPLPEIDFKKWVVFLAVSRNASIFRAFENTNYL